MNQREIIVRNLEMTGPERIGLAFSAPGRVNDIVGAGLDRSKTFVQKTWSEAGFDYYDDAWGNTWYRVSGMSKGGEIFRPALADWSGLEKLALPDYDDPARYEKARAAFAGAGDRYRMGYLPGFPFAICRYLRKMEVYFQDLVLERENIDRLHDLVTGLLEKMIDLWAGAGADGVFFCEDWGTQERLLISPKMWREIFGPIYRRLCGRARRAGLHVLMHSCGYNRDILDDLAEAGVNAFQFDQPALYGLESLAAKMRRLRVCLFSPVDIQRVMPTGDPDLIAGQARKMADLFGNGEGGLIARAYGDLPGIGVTPEADECAYRAFLENASLPR